VIRPPVLIQRGEINSFRRIEEVADRRKCRIVEDMARMELYFHFYMELMNIVNGKDSA
jgi:hypothetical protein